ncbi:MAG: TonB-dependent receptor [Bacteroidales bacterium]|jgi:outer membrane receptor protein involved in Fe transport|nr:TonB-dependent receptor [Bacteroidales bacterium]
MNKLLFVIAICISTCGVIFSQTDITGKVLEKGSNKPIDAADVILTKKGTTATVAHILSDVAGQFTLSGINAGEYTLTVWSLGYDVFNNPQITVSSSATLNVGVIELQSLEVGLAEVEIRAEKRQIVYKLDKKVIDATGNLMSSGGTAVDILENAPSVRVDVEGGVTFRGSSGFKVYIDGRPSMYTGTQALQQIPASQIENIEIITTPSARYDTDGDVGMINIITKKHSMQGWNGMVNVYGNTALSNGADFLLTHQAKKLKWSVAAHWNKPVRESHFEQDKTTIVNGITTHSYSNGPRTGTSYHYGVRGGIEYMPAERTTLNLGMEILYDKYTRDGILNYKETRTDGVTPLATDEYISGDDFDLHATVTLGRIGFDHKFNDKGHKLSGGFLLAYEGDALEYFQSDLFDAHNQQQQGHRAWEDEVRQTVRGNLDYVYPFSPTGKLQTGYQYHSYLEDGDYSMQFWNPATQAFFWRDDIYNTFYFQRGIHSVYAIASESYKKFDFQAGLRGEHTHQVLRSSIEGAGRIVNRFEVFPSVHAGYNLPKEQTLTVAYSYRTNRPELFFMEPYITYRDYYSAEKGNPDIRPEYIHSSELNYKKDLKEHVLASSLFYRYRKDKIERLRVPYEAGVTLDSMANVGQDRALGLELNGQFKMNRWWNLNLSGNIYYYKVENQYKMDGNDETSVNYDFTLNNLFQVHKNTRIQLDGNFVGPSVTTQGRSDAFWFANIAVRQQWFRNFQSTLSFRDIFNAARYRSDISTANLESITRIRPQYPVIRLTLTYTFNNYKKNDDSRDGRDLFEGVNH